MLTILVSIGIAQAAAVPVRLEEDPYHVEDPFAIEAAPSPVVAAPAQAATPPPSQKRLVCRSRPELGTRLRRLRVCMTAAEWNHHETNMEQQRRDINDWGAQGGAGPE